jgi:hypothetical protein
MFVDHMNRFSSRGDKKSIKEIVVLLVRVKVRVLVWESIREVKKYNQNVKISSVKELSIRTALYAS